MAWSETTRQQDTRPSMFHIPTGGSPRQISDNPVQGFFSRQYRFL